MDDALQRSGIEHLEDGPVTLGDPGHPLPNINFYDVYVSQRTQKGKGEHPNWKMNNQVTFYRFYYDMVFLTMTRILK